jgi:predicted Co/Zn/Cd cation transporter (cation efflux family)
VGIVLYIAFYYINNAMSFLVSRLLEGGLGYPVENAGRLVGFTSMVSLAMAVVYFRFSSRVRHKKWLIMTGFLMAAFIGTWMINMPPDVSMPWLVAPMVLRGLLLLFIALPVANLTFRVFAIDEYSHGYRFKNIVKQLTYSFSTATIIILEQHRVALHQTRLVETVNVYDPTFQSVYQSLLGAFERMGHGASEAKSLALVEIGRIVTQQANFLSSMDGFHYIIGVALCASAIAAWQKQID